MCKRRIFIKVEGIVQGVGFRPFVYNLAAKCSLKGWVNNNSEGVYIDIEGDTGNVDNFLYELKNNPPVLSRIEKITIYEKPLENYKNFVIKQSEEKEDKITLISPDMSICQECRNDIFDKTNRRFRYPFTNCTNCGPRFSIIKSIPYDRDKTTMSVFPMCSECYDEYTDPTNRRFHAQPNACKECGPHVFLTDNQGKSIETECDPIEWAVKKLKEGLIFAVKGLCGFHLVCDAHNESTVSNLRVRKRRPYKPFAVMMKDMETIKKYCYVSEAEEKVLTGIRKPIVLLKRKPSYNFPENIAPSQNTLGVMLPYTPLHELLFVDGSDTLIMTSANVYGLPLEYKNDSAQNKLRDIVDYYLMHNRDIHIPVDDSVVKFIGNEERMIRRARGYVPDPLKIKNIKSILACGPNMKNTFCIAKEDFIFISQHNGDLENIETYEHYKRNVEHFKNIFSFEPQYIAYDMHPNYTSTEYAESYNLPKLAVQHHHAHIASCMAENGITNKLIGISFDGTGFGTDGKIWGGEFLVCDFKGFTRTAHINYVKMPGGEKAIKEPWRMAVSYIFEALKFEENLKKINSECNTAFSDTEELLLNMFDEKVLTVLKMIQGSINSPETSSMGRLFDAVSGILGISDIVTYEGQASIELETKLDKNVSERYEFSISKDKDNSSYIISTDKLITDILIDSFNKVPIGKIAAKFHNAIIEIAVEVTKLIAAEIKINEVALSGGVFQNSYLLENVVLGLENNNFKVYTHKKIPTNDGGISLGQIMIANEYFS